jgi:hypothetical protein
MRHELFVGSAKGMAFGGGKIREGHFEMPADLGVQVMDLAGESIGRQPLGQSVGIQEGSIDFFRRGAQHAMQTHGIGVGFAHGLICFYRVVRDMTNE